MGCLGYFLGDLLPSCLKHFFAIPGPNQDYTSSPHNISMLEGHGSPTSHRSFVNLETDCMSEILKLPSPPASCVSASSKPVADEYERWKPISYNPTPPLPMTRSRERRKPPVVYSSTLGMLFIQVLFILFRVWWTNSVGIKQFSKYEGVMYKASTPYYLCLFVEYDDSAVGYVGVPSSSFNANVSLKQNLKEIVPQDYWGYLEEKYGFRFVNSL